MIVDVPFHELPRVVPLFRALHNFHVEREPWRRHGHGTDAQFLEHLHQKVRSGAWVIAAEAGWGLVGYILAEPRERTESFNEHASRHVQLDHIYVAPTHRGGRVAPLLVKSFEDEVWKRGYSNWRVGFSGYNQHAARFYRGLGAQSLSGSMIRWCD